MSAKKRRRSASPKKLSKSKSKPKVEETIEDLVAKYDNIVLKTSEHGLKIINSVTGHEIKATKDNLLIYLNTKDFTKGEEKWYDDSLFEKYLPNIVPHLKNSKKLVCRITKKHLNKIPSQVEKHINGKAYKKKLKEKVEFEKNHKKVQREKPEEVKMDEETEE